MISGFKPMLADDANIPSLRYPLLTSPKLDGVRATFVDGKLLTRSLKPLANKAIQKLTCGMPLDGELIAGDPCSKSCFRDTMTVVTAHIADIKDVKFYVFDWVSTTELFKQRLAKAVSATSEASWMIPVPHLLVENEVELLRLEERVLDQGYEGLMLRDPNGAYKFGRSTASQGLLLKLKRKQETEAMVIGFAEQMHNTNEARIDNLGYTERSTHQANLIPAGILGALIVRDLKTEVQFNIGTGFTLEDRKFIWEHRDAVLRKIVKYEYLPYGVKDKPRHPAFLGWRAVEDM